MKLTIWERNNIFSLLGSIQDAPWKDLEIVRDLREKFRNEELEIDWRRYASLDKRRKDSLTEEQAEFLSKYEAEIHIESEEIELTKREFQFIYSRLSNNTVRLPAGIGLEHSINFKQKLEKTKEEVDLI